MENRIRFNTDVERKDFFFRVRKESGVSSWAQLAEKLGLRRTHFQEYQSGKILLPQRLFDTLNSFLSNSDAEKGKSSISVVPGNWGASKGGKVTYTRHPEIFATGREIGMRNRLQKLSQSLTVDVPLSEALCELVGAIIGDGNIDGHVKSNGFSNYHFSITGHAILDKAYVAKHLPTLVKKVFDVGCTQQYSKDCCAIRTNFYSKYVFQLFTRRFGFIPGNKTYTVRIPDEILHSEEKLVFATIRGIFDTDGCVFFDRRKGYKKPYPRISIQIVSKPLFEQLKEFLERYFSLYTYHHEKREMYCLEVYGHKQCNRWMQLIGFSNEKHLTKIRELQAGIAPATSASLESVPVNKEPLIPMPCTTNYAIGAAVVEK